MEPMNTLGILFNAAAVYLINRSRESAHPLFAKFTAANPGFLRLVSLLLATLAAAGVSATFSDSTLTVTGLNQENALKFISNVVQGFLAQQGMYRVDSALREVAKRPVQDRTPEAK